MSKHLTKLAMVLALLAFLVAAFCSKHEAGAGKFQ
jgi:hypothetical protein